MENQFKPKGIVNSEARKRIEGLGNPNDPKPEPKPDEWRKPIPVNHIMIARSARQAIIKGK